MPTEKPIPAYAVVYRKLPNGRWNAKMVDVPEIDVEASGIDEVKAKAASAARTRYLRHKEAFPPSTSVVGYLHLDGLALGEVTVSDPDTEA